jgi:hypothetical protein
MTKENKRNLYDFCFNMHYQREIVRYTEDDVIEFKNKYSYFLSPEITTQEIYFEFTCFHLHKWIRRLGLNFTTNDTREYMKVKWGEFAYFA